MTLEGLFGTLISGRDEVMRGNMPRIGALRPLI